VAVCARSVQSRIGVASNVLSSAIVTAVRRRAVGPGASSAESERSEQCKI
jgi:hypothetical protein